MAVGTALWQCLAVERVKNLRQKYHEVCEVPDSLEGRACLLLDTYFSHSSHPPGSPAALEKPLQPLLRAAAHDSGHQGCVLWLTTLPQMLL